VVALSVVGTSPQLGGLLLRPHTSKSWLIRGSNAWCDHKAGPRPSVGRANTSYLGIGADWERGSEKQMESRFCRLPI